MVPDLVVLVATGAVLLALLTAGMVALLRRSAARRQREDQIDADIARRRPAELKLSPPIRAVSCPASGDVCMLRTCLETGECAHQGYN